MDDNDLFVFDDDMPVSEWVQFLTEHNICSPDGVGNMPCDYGNGCCKCMAEHIQTHYEAWLKDKSK